MDPLPTDIARETGVAVSYDVSKGVLDALESGQNYVDVVFFRHMGAN